MKSLSGVELGLSIVFGSLLLALVAELYYLLWWKKRLATKIDVENFFYMFCLKASSSSSSSMAHSALNPQEIRPTNDEQLQQPHQFIMELKPFDDHGMMRNELMGPPRFLFTIVEETKEDLECCEEGKSKGKFGSTMILNVETPYLTPLASPPFLTPPHTPIALIESASDADELNKLRSSPPPKFKFLKEAEEKLQRKEFMGDNTINGTGFDDEEEENGEIMTPSSSEEESFITIDVDRNKERGFNIEMNSQNHDHQQQQQQFHPSSASQVLPVSSSPASVPSNKN